MVERHGLRVFCLIGRPETKPLFALSTGFSNHPIEQRHAFTPTASRRMKPIPRQPSFFRLCSEIIETSQTGDLATMQ